MAGKSRRRGVKLPDPERVLAGSVRASARELMALIREVNPTGEDLPDKQARRQYGLKSRLQSLLLNSHFENVRVVEETPGSGIVLITHRASDDSACHALVAELDDDARSRVRMALDMDGGDAADDGTKSCASRPADTAASDTDAASAVDRLISGSRSSLAEYDYDAARSQLEAAFHLPDGAERASFPLLELLVEHLGADDDALALEPAVPAGVERGGAVAALLATAAARAGDRSRARRLLRKAEGPRAAAVHALLASRSLDLGALDHAAEDLRHCKELHPACPDVPALVARLQRLRADEQRPCEETAARLVGEGSGADAWEAVADLLRRYPDNPVGARLQRELETRRALAEHDRLVTKAEQSVRRGEVGVAIGSLRQALSLGLGPENTRSSAEMLRSLEDQVRSEMLSSKVDRVVRLLADSEGPDALSAYLECSPSAREEIRARCPSQAIELVESLVATERGLRPRAAAAAIDALLRAERVANERPQSALDILAEQKKTLAALPRAAQLECDAKRTLREHQARDALRSLERAAEELAAGRPDAARTHIDDATIERLPEDRRARARQIRAQAERLLAAEARWRDIGELAEQEAPFAALRAVDGWLCSCDELDAERLRTLKGQVLAKISKDLRMHRDVEPRPWTSAPELALGTGQRGWRNLLADGRTLLGVHRHERWVLLTVADIIDRVIRARVAFRYPRDLALRTFTVSGDRLLLIDRNAHILEISTDTWEVVGTTSLPSIVPHRQSKEIRVSRHVVIEGSTERDIVTAPGGRFLWAFDFTGNEHRAGVIDITNGEVTRVIQAEGTWMLQSKLPELDVPKVVLLRLGPEGAKAFELLDPDGTAAERIEAGGLVPLDAIVAHPDGKQVLFAVIDPVRGASPAEMPTRWMLRRSDGTVAPAGIDDVPPGHAALFCVCDRQSGMVFVIEETHARGRELLGLRARRNGLLKAAYRVPLPSQAMIVLPIEGGAVSVVVPREGGPEVVRLGRDKPRFRSDPTPPQFGYPSPLLLTDPCHQPLGRRGEEANKLAAWLASAHPSDVRSRIRAALERDDIDTLLSIVAGSDLVRRSLEGLIKELRRRYPDQPEVRVHLAREHAAARRWNDVAACLEGLDLLAIEPSTARHALHLTALAQLERGMPAPAAAALDNARSFPGLCDLRYLEILAGVSESGLAVVTGREAAREVEPVEFRYFRQVLRDIRAADAHLARGDACAALGCLDTIPVWQMGETQTFARMAHACLALVAAGQLDPLRCMLVTTAYLNARRKGAEAGRFDLPLRESRWLQDRLDGLDARCDAWLGGCCTG